MKWCLRAGLISALIMVSIGCENRTARFKKSILPELAGGSEPEINRNYALNIDAERVALTKAYFKAHNQALFNQMPAGDTPQSITFTPRIVVVHFTAIDSLEKTADYFAPNRIAGNRGLVTDSGALNVGIQYMVDQDGTIYASYPDNMMSRHVIGLNHVAIGIENIGNADLNAPAKDGQLPLTDAQLKANSALIRYLKQKYPTIEFMIGHYEYRDLEHPSHPAHSLFAEDQPAYRTDKVDPGKRFMEALRKDLRQK